MDDILNKTNFYKDTIILSPGKFKVFNIDDDTFDVGGNYSNDNKIMSISTPF